MAGRGPARKAAGAVADRRNGQQAVQRADGTLVAPRAPTGLPSSVRKAWNELWDSDVAVLLQRSDLAALRRLFLLYAEREHCHDVVTSRRVTKLPLDEALKAGASGELVHELADDGETHTFVLVEHEGRIAIGSQGQQVLSPWARDLRTIDAEIRQLEDRFGLNVRARAALAVTVRPHAAPDVPPPLPPTGPASAAPDPAADVINDF
jgi:hypothetical protein